MRRTLSTLATVVVALRDIPETVLLPALVALVLTCGACQTARTTGPGPAADPTAARVQHRETTASWNELEQAVLGSHVVVRLGPGWDHRVPVVDGSGQTRLRSVPERTHFRGSDVVVEDDGLVLSPHDFAGERWRLPRSAISEVRLLVRDDDPLGGLLIGGGIGLAFGLGGGVDEDIKTGTFAMLSTVAGSLIGVISDLAYKGWTEGAVVYLRHDARR